MKIDVQKKITVGSIHLLNTFETNNNLYESEFEVIFRMP